MPSPVSSSTSEGTWSFEVVSVAIFASANHLSASKRFTVPVRASAATATRSDLGRGAAVLPVRWAHQSNVVTVRVDDNGVA